MAPPFMTKALGGEWSASLSGRFTPGERTPGTHRIGWVGPKGGLDAVGEEKNPVPARNRTLAVQPVARRYTDWAIPAPEQTYENRTEHTNTLYGQNVEFWCVKAGDAYSNQSVPHRKHITSPLQRPTV
jgi:hypothetical protein